LLPEGHRERSQGLRRFAATLGGWVLVLLPEGHRERSPGLRRFAATLSGGISVLCPERARETDIPPSLSQVYIHLVFSTKARRPLIHPEWKPRLHDFLGGVLRDLNSPSIEINSEPDHVHLLFRMAKTITVSDVVMNLKRGSSLAVKQFDPRLQDFYWQAGYGAFSVSESQLETVRQYIRNQQEHHRKESFQDEFRRLLKEYNLEFDERYVWD
jgi:putative transposase